MLKEIFQQTLRDEMKKEKVFIFIAGMTTAFAIVFLCGLVGKSESYRDKLYNLYFDSCMTRTNRMLSKCDKRLPTDVLKNINCYDKQCSENYLLKRYNITYEEWLEKSCPEWNVGGTQELYCRHEAWIWITMNQKDPSLEPQIMSENDAKYRLENPRCGMEYSPKGGC